MTKKFTVINESFECNNCGFLNKPLPGSCRNHCSKCLYSLHLDKAFPGDRMSDCHGLLKPVGLEHNKKKGNMIIHQCTKCNYTILNKVAEDDNFDAVIKLSQKF